jgi:hypothetical protein
MVVLVLKVLPEVDNVESIEFPRDHEWCLDIDMGGTGEIRDKVVVSRSDEFEVPNSRGTANLVLKMDTGSYATVTILDIPKFTKDVISASDSESGLYTPIVAFDCRGCEIKKWHPTGYYTVTTPSGTTFSEVDLQLGEWYDVDKETNLPVSIMSVKHELDIYRK